jgi:hypothetical protein
VTHHAIRRSKGWNPLSRRRFLDLSCGGTRPAAKNQIPDALSVAAQTVLTEVAESQLAARRQTSAERRFAGVRLRIAGGRPQRILDKGQQHMPGEEAWLIGEWRPSGERKYYLANLPAKAGLQKLAAAIKARWVCEQPTASHSNTLCVPEPLAGSAHQQMKEELGLDHFEGRSWRSLHRHACNISVSSRRSGKKRIHQGPPQPTLQAVRCAVIKALSRKQLYERCPHCRMRITAHYYRNNSAKVVIVIVVI